MTSNTGNSVFFVIFTQLGILSSHYSNTLNTDRYFVVFVHKSRVVDFVPILTSMYRIKYELQLQHATLAQNITTSSL